MNDEADRQGNAPRLNGPDEKQQGREDAGKGESIVEPENALPEIALSELPEQLRGACARAGWTRLLPVQARAMPYMLAGRNLMVQSRTGSGKTGAYLLPVLEKIDPKRAVCQALVLVPTRELAVQVAKEAVMLFGDTGVNTVAVYGGVGYGPQLDAFRKGAHLVVGTPGRILDHLLKKSVSLEGLRILVFDEADRMLSMGFYPDMKRLQEYLPARRLNGHMFSATFPPYVLRLAGEFLEKPEFLSLSRDNIHVAETEHVYYTIPGIGKERALIRIIEIENPVSAIIFCNTRTTVHFVSVVLKRFGYDADELSSDLGQSAREKVLDRVRTGDLRFLVATDVASRGIDIPDLSHVIQYEPPEDHEIYVHRAGRTGRVGASGVAITLVAGMEQFKLRDIAKIYTIDLQERPLPGDADVEAIVAERTMALLEARLRSLDSLQSERMKRFIPLGRSLSESEDGLQVMAMLLDDYYHTTLQAPPPRPPSAEAARSKTGMDREKKKRPSRSRGPRTRR
ncbi:MAG: DEAD/DEAH box helicase [Deltaproteobacteria bacterium]|nr:DEAD/DEAH box helicase [Deltaproteobacteria bacterium]